MVRYKFCIFLVFIVLLLWSCGPSQRELAVQKINTAKNVLATGDTLAALAIIDSVKILFPEAKVQIGVADNIRKVTLQQMIDQRKLQLIKLDSVIFELEKNFVKEKTEFDMYWQYNHKQQTLNRSWDRSFLQVHLDERGVMYLSSNYMGKEWLNHTGIRVYDGQLQAKSERVPVGDALNHRSDFMDYKWERVSYMDGKADSVIHFIANNSNLNLKCVFLGARYYYILLEKFDVEAVVDALKLSEAIKKRESLDAEIEHYDLIL
ncbi:MAG TPA: hypothetical protein PLF35_15140 [Prolixibacteraceae bacterium]|nr:hypothetical protein [Prolixibacteraceae bacterium]